MHTGDVFRGFAEPVFASQRVFRAALDVMARPGRIVAVRDAIEAPRPLAPTAAALLLALTDFETTIWFDPPLAQSADVASFIRFHTGARLTRDPARADFALASEPRSMPPLAAFSQGTPEYPDRSTTLILQVDAMTDRGWTLQGPGIDGRSSFGASPLPHDFLEQLAANRGMFPLGVDLVFATTTEIAALPRTTAVTEERS